MALPSSGPLALTDIQGEFGGANPIGMNEYYAGGGLVPAGTSGTYGAVPSSGTISVQNFYGTSNFVPIYIEDVFSTFLYTANNVTQTIANGIDLSTKGGLMWFKTRNTGGAGATHTLVDSARGNNGMFSSLTSAQSALSGGSGTITLNNNGFTINGSVYSAQGNINYGTSDTLVSWTFRKQPKFFDVVTYTGNGVTGRSIAHNLGSIPGAIIIKNTSSSANWAFALATDVNNWSGTSKLLCLNTTDADYSGPTYSNGSVADATSSTFTVVGFSGNQLNVNQSGETYVAYLFASNAGGFGLTGSDNVITCGSYTGNGSSGQAITLGYEPQWLLLKNTTNYSGASNWILMDTMRGWTMQQNDASLFPNLANAESTTDYNGNPTATGFVTGPNFTTNGAGEIYIYIAIRRGPMKVPTVGTSVFAPVTTTTGGAYTTNFPVDLAMARALGTNYNFTGDRLRGGSVYVVTSQTFSEGAAGSNGWSFDSNTSVTQLQNYVSAVNWNFRRAPGFFDEVCYKGNGASTQSINHNLTVAPEMIIAKSRSSSGSWYVYTTAMPAVNRIAMYLNSDTGGGVIGTGGVSIWGLTSTTFNADFNTMDLNNNGVNFVAYLFATCAGVSKVGSYTGTGALQTINCGFTAGARFVLIKRIDSSGSWYVWDSARGISSGSDPYLLWNAIDPEVTGTNYVDTTSVGFQVTAAAPSDINFNGGKFIFLAIA